MPADASKLGNEILQSLMNRLGKWWDDMAEEDQNTLSLCADDYAGLLLLALADPKDARVKRERKKVEATISHLASINASKARMAMQGAIRDAVKLALSLVLPVA